MQKAASAVDAETSFRAAARTSPGAVSDLQRAETAHAYVQVLTGRLLAIAPEQKSAAPNARFSSVASGVVIHRLLLPEAADLKQKFDPWATARSTRLVVRDCWSAPGLARAVAMPARATVRSTGRAKVLF